MAVTHSHHCELTRRCCAAAPAVLPGQQGYIAVCPVSCMHISAAAAAVQAITNMMITSAVLLLGAHLVKRKRLRGFLRLRVAHLQAEASYQPHPKQSANRLACGSCKITAAALLHAMHSCCCLPRPGPGAHPCQQYAPCHPASLSHSVACT
jgi:hypothetical protein